MNQRSKICVVVANDGQRGTFRPPEPSTAYVDVTPDNGPPLRVPTHLLQPQPDGTYRLAVAFTDLHAASNAPSPKAHPDDSAAVQQTMPLVEESLELHHKTVETGKVQVIKTVHTEEKEVDLPIEWEEVTIERVPMDQIVSEAPGIRREGDCTIIPLVEEILVVEKRLIVREEIRLTTRRTQTHRKEIIELRKESAQIKRVSGA